MDTEKSIKSNQENNRDLTNVPDINNQSPKKIPKLAIVALSLSILVIIFIYLMNFVISCLFIPLILSTALLAIVMGLKRFSDFQVSKSKIEIFSIFVIGFAFFTGWMAPSFIVVYKFKLEVIQQAQLFSIDTVLELFNSEFDGYPPSGALDPVGKPYCGAMKLCEVIMGQDLMGFHPDSTFRSDGMDPNGIEKLYSKDTIQNRNRLYIPPQKATAYRLNELYQDVGPFDGNIYVYCDFYTKKRHSGKKIGMPVLYYKADTSKTFHDINNPNNPDNIYNYKDNHDLLALGVPGRPDLKHPMFEDPKIFYELTGNHKVTTHSRPFKSDTFILLSAGKDGLYGTQDDIANFDFKLKPK